MQPVTVVRGIAVVLLLALLGGCTADPGGALIRPTSVDRYGRWLASVAEPINDYSRAFTRARSQVQAGTVSREVADRVVATLQDGGRTLATSLRQRPYPGGAPLPPSFGDDYATLLGDLTALGDEWFACRASCSGTFEATFRTATDIWQIAVALASYDRLAAPLAARRHRIADAVLTAAPVPSGWSASDLDLSRLQQPCDVGAEQAADGQTELAVVSLRNSTSLARHSIVRFRDPDTAAAYVNATRLRLALCRQRLPATDELARSGLDLSSVRDLPSTTWSVTGGAPTPFTVTTVEVLVADTVCRVSVAAPTMDQATALADAFADQALTRLDVEVPQ